MPKGVDETGVRERPICVLHRLPDNAGIASQAIMVAADLTSLD